MSIVEMMVGIAVGLIIVAAASMTVATQLSDNRRLLAEVQLQQDLRAAADFIARDLRRAGYWASANVLVWAEGSSPATFGNALAPLSPASGPTNSLEYRYDRRTGGGAESWFGFCQGAGCAGGGGLVRSKFAAFDGSGASWQPLTDDKTVNITALTLTPTVASTVRLACPSLCPGADGIANTADDDTACWPTLSVREVVVTLTGHTLADPSVSRTLTSRVRLRNDQMTLLIPGASPGSLMPCPAL